MNNRLWFLITFSFMLFSCTSATTCASKSMILDESDFPIPVAADAISSPLSDSTDSAGRTFYITPNSNSPALAFHTIARYTFKKTAVKEFEAQKELIFRIYKGEDSWNPMSSLDKANLSADQYFSACGIVEPFSDQRCAFIAQYGEYFTLFSAELTEGGMTTSAFLDIISKIDSTISACSN